MDEQQFAILLARLEGPDLDFKATSYDLSTDRSKANFIKDIIAMANTPREGAGYFVLGVKKHVDGTYDLWGLDKDVDDAQLQDKFPTHVNPVPIFTYDVVHYQGKRLGLITIPPRRQGPCIPIDNFFPKPKQGMSPVLQKDQVWWRRGTMNTLATPEEIYHIMQWFRIPTTLLTQHDDSEAWDRLIDSVHGFDPARRYMLLAPPLRFHEPKHIEAIALIPWVAIFDFDPESESSGLFAKAHGLLGEQRHIHRVVKGNRVAINIDRSTEWFFARGLADQITTLAEGPFRNWLSLYQQEVTERLRSLAAAINPHPVTFIALWYDDQLIRHLQQTFASALGVFQGSADFVIVTDAGQPFVSIQEDVEAAIIEMPLHHLCLGLQAHTARTRPAQPELISIPSSHGSPIPIDADKRSWLEEEVEIVDLGAGSMPPESLQDGNDFYHGAELTWYEAKRGDDVVRGRYNRVKRQVQNDLRANRTVRVNLYHAPGAGGSTVARHLLWEFHMEYPTVVLLRTNPRDTADRLSYLSALSSSVLLLLIDGAQISERQVDELFGQLRSRQIPVVMLQTLRRFKRQEDRDRSTYLQAELDEAEAHQFCDVFSRQHPEKRQELEHIRDSIDREHCTAFYFGLQTFERNFKDLTSYVHTRLENITQDQRNILTSLALAYHYGQRAMPAQAFAESLGLQRSRVVDLNRILPDEARELLIEEREGTWRIAHDLIAMEIIEQVFTPSAGDRRAWANELSSFAKGFIELCRGSSLVESDEMLEIVSRVFIYRDNIDVLGSERAGLQTFAQIIDDIPSPMGRLEVLRHLVDYFPEVAHFWGHLGRYYSIRLHNYEEALNCLDHAIAIQPKDNVLFHMKGMATRQYIYELIDERASVAAIIDLMKAASDFFEQARMLSPDDVHSYISEAQMVTRVLDYVGRQYPGGIFECFKRNDSDPFLRESLARAEDLLEQVRRGREGEGPNSFELSCRASLNSLYGNYSAALETWDNLLQKQGVYRPPLRRQAVWTYLARSGRTWDALSGRDIDRIMDLLEENLQAEPHSQRDLRLWIQAVRYSKRAPSIEAIIERISYWRATSGSLDAVYYLYVLNSLLAMQGFRVARNDALRFIEECRELSRYRRNRTKSFEWIGPGEGIASLVHHSELGEWLRQYDFWERPEKLVRIPGRIVEIEREQAGHIEVKGGLEAFFVPRHGGFSRSDSLNTQVDFYLGFSYDGLIAWDVKSL